MGDVYLDYVSAAKDALNRGLPTPNVTTPSLPFSHTPEKDDQKTRALIFSPHPDDETLTGALPLRLKKEADWQIINVAVTLGSDHGRRKKRWHELIKACAVLGFDLLQPEEAGFSGVNTSTREKNPIAWGGMVERITDILLHYNANTVFVPHDEDGHITHKGTHQLIMDALVRMPSDFSCNVIQTEFWNPQRDPNLMVRLAEEDAAQLLKALCCHEGEVVRAGYATNFLPFMMDSARRGSTNRFTEGAETPDAGQAMMYAASLWDKGQMSDRPKNKVINISETPLNGLPLRPQPLVGVVEEWQL